MINKDKIRKKMISIRKNLNLEELINLNKSILTHIFTNIDLLKKFNSFAFYYPTNNEIDILPVALWALENNKKVYFPKILKNNKMKFYEILNLSNDFKIGKFNIKEPIGNMYNNNIDCYFIPTVGINNQKVRLGMGGGFYDRYFAKHEGYKIALTYSFSNNLNFEHDKWDMSPDMIISDKNILCLKK